MKGKTTEKCFCFPFLPSGYSLTILNQNYQTMPYEGFVIIQTPTSRSCIALKRER
jgi:hypothetical protein